MSPFFLAVLGLVSGILFHSFFSIHFSYSFFVLLLSLSALGYFWIFDRQVIKNRSNFFVLCLFLMSMSLGMLRYDLSEIHKNPLPENFLEKQVIVEGVIIDEPDERDTNTKLTILLDTISLMPVEAKILSTVDPYSSFSYGDRVKFSGVLSYPENFSGDTGREFDYVSYLAKDGIYYISNRPKIEVVSTGGGNFIKRNLLAVKHAFVERIESVITSPESSLLGGLLLGSKRALGKELQEEFRRAGVIHVVVLSGYNVSIVATAIMNFFSFLERGLGILLGVGSIILFALMTGASATTVRASIMAIFVLLSGWIGRRYDVTRALVIAGVLMLIHNPKILVFDVSFQLSFLSTVALIYVSPLFAHRLKFIPEKFKFREIVISTLATQIFVLPFLIYTMGDVSLVGLPVNVLILGLIPVTMFLGFFSGLFAFIHFIVALPFAYLATLLLSYELGVVHLFSSFSFASVSFPTFSAVFVIIIYILYGYILWKFYEKKPLADIVKKA